MNLNKLLNEFKINNELYLLPNIYLEDGKPKTILVIVFLLVMW